MDASPLSKLPRELRNDIYLEVLLHDGTIELVASFFRRPSCKFSCKSKYPREWLALTCTCKPLRHETHALFFGINSFEISDPWYGITNTAPSRTFRSLLKGVITTPSARKAVKSITLNLGQLESGNGETLLSGAVKDLKRSLLAASPPEACLPLTLKINFVGGYSHEDFEIFEKIEIDLQSLAASIGAVLERVEELRQETFDGHHPRRYQRLKELKTLTDELYACWQ